MKYGFFKSNIENSELRKVGRHKILIGIIFMLLAIIIFVFPTVIEFRKYGGIKHGDNIPGLLIDSLQYIVGKSFASLILFAISIILGISGIRNIRKWNKINNAS